jgi:hypothetical protein
VSSTEIFALRKKGQTAQALEMARVEYPANAEDLWFLRAYGWALYDHARKLVDAYETNQLSPSVLSGKFSPYMREFARMANTLRGDTTFSQMLRLAGKVSKDWDEFLGFARWAGTQDFSEEDKKPFVNESGKTIDSLQKRFIRAICREVAVRANDSQLDNSLRDWGCGVLQDALEREPNDQWLNYYQSKLHLANGEVDLAVRRLAPVLRRQSRASWPWALLGEVFESTRPDAALICFAHAVQLAREEQEVAKVRIRLAQRLALEGRFGEAAQQAHLALQYREKHGYRIPNELQQLLSSDWYKQALTENGLQTLPKVESDARTLLQELDRQNLSYVTGVVDHINNEKALSYVATSTNAGVALTHRKFPEMAQLPPGTLVEIGRADPEGPPLDWRHSEADSLPGLCETFSGTLERQEGKDFAFIRTAKGDVFVPPMLASSFLSGQQHQLSCRAIKRTNKQGKTGWRAMTILEQ